jgi:hypothetical protein
MKKPISWSKAKLSKWRKLMDPEADQAVLEIYTPQRFAYLKEFLLDLARNDSFSAKDIADLPIAFKTLLEKKLNHPFLPTDISAFHTAAEVWKRYGIQFIFVLFFRSLPLTYLAEKPANVLRLTRLLKDQPQRRIIETAQFVFDVMEPGWWLPHHRGLVSIVKVRLLHAALRYQLLNHPDGEPWNLKAWGCPISQEDLIATNQVFSLEFLQGIRLLGHQLTDHEQQAWYHTWKVIGQIIGVEPDFQCDHYTEAWQQQHSIYRHLFVEDTRAGQALGKALVTTIAQFLIGEKLALMIMKYMLQDDAQPTLFYRLFSKDYIALYPELFQVDKTFLPNPIFDLHWKESFVFEIKSLRQRLQVKRKTEKTKAVGLKPKKSLLETQRKRLQALEKELAPDLVGFGPMYHDSVRKTMHSISNIIMSLLAGYFRSGKGANFRIPADLKDHWALD